MLFTILPEITIPFIPFAADSKLVKTKLYLFKATITLEKR